MMKCMSVMMESDIHGCHLSGLARGLTEWRFRISVTAVCKPGAGNSAVPPESFNVTITGTIDIITKQSHTICEYLERIVASRLKSSKVIFSAIPDCYDLPYWHPINIIKKLRKIQCRDAGFLLHPYMIVYQSRDTLTDAEKVSSILQECIKRLDQPVWTAARSLRCSSVGGRGP